MFRSNQHGSLPWQSKIILATTVPTWLGLFAWSVFTETSRPPDGIAAFALVGFAGLLGVYGYRWFQLRR